MYNLVKRGNRWREEDCEGDERRHIVEDLFILCIYWIQSY